MANQRSPLLPVVLAAIAVAVAILWLRRPQPAADDPLGACPAGAFLVARADVAALRSTVLGDSVDPLLRALVPLPRTVGESCGFDPVGRIDALALVVPEREEQNDIGLALKLRATPDELSRCARGLAKDQASSTERRGAFEVFPTGDARADTLAASANGLTVIGPRAWATSMVDVANGRAPSAASAPPHAELLRAAARKDARARSLLVSVALPTATRVRLRQELEKDPTSKESGSKEAEESMAGVLGVEAVAAAVDVAEKTDVAVELRCETERACAAVKDLVERKQRAWRENTVVRLLGLEPAVSGLTTTLAPKRLSLNTSIATSELRDALERLLSWRRSTRSPRPSASGSNEPK